MDTNEIGNIASIIEKRLPLARKIVDVEAELKSLDSAVQHLQNHQNQSLKRLDHSNGSSVLGNICLTTLQSSINTELKALTKLKERFCRKTLNIGVVGRAKQGKSRLLQSITGLTSAEIPDGEKHHCTDFCSFIYNNYYRETYAEVWFHSEQSFLDELIGPYYEKLGLGEKPKTIDEFATKPLPLLLSNHPEYPAQVAAYERLLQYHIHLDKYRSLLQQPSPRRISQDEIREYVAQEIPSSQSIFVNPSGISSKDGEGNRQSHATYTPRGNPQQSPQALVPKSVATNLGTYSSRTSPHGADLYNAVAREQPEAYEVLSLAEREGSADGENQISDNSLHGETASSSEGSFSTEETAARMTGLSSAGSESLLQERFPNAVSAKRTPYGVARASPEEIRVACPFDEAVPQAQDIGVSETYAKSATSPPKVLSQHLAVREIKIACQYPNPDVGQIAFVDMPGLGDTGIWDEQVGMKILGQQVDAILFVRMPKSTEDDWTDVDVRLYDTVRTAQVDVIPTNLCSFMILNRTEADSRFGDNSKSCQDLTQDIADTKINVVKCLTANCANTQEAHKVVEQVLDYLKAKMSDLEEKYAFLRQEKLNLLQNQVKAELEKVSKALDLATHDDIHGLGLFEEKFKELWLAVTNSLEELLTELRQKRETVDMDFKKQVEAVLQTCRSDTGIPSIKEIEQRFCLEKSYETIYEKYLNEIRAHLSKHLSSLDIGLERSLNKVKSQVIQILMDKGHLEKLTQAKGGEFMEAIAEQIPNELIPGIPSQLKYGLQTLAKFKLSYRGFLQYRIRKCLDGLTPNQPSTLKLSASSSAEQVLLNLKIAYAEAVSKCEKALKELLREPSQIIYAIVEEFVDCILRAKDVENEWRIFLQDVRGQIWQEFQHLSDTPLPKPSLWGNAHKEVIKDDRTQLPYKVSPNLKIRRE